MPKVKPRTAVLRRLKEVFRRAQSQPGRRVIGLINPIVRGWVNYFRIGRESLLCLRPRLGGEEGAAPLDAGEEPAGLRLEEVE
jgi:hypothetical protein